MYQGWLKAISRFFILEIQQLFRFLRKILLSVNMVTSYLILDDYESIYCNVY